MTAADHNIQAVATEAEFVEALQQLLVSAHSSGIDLLGSWEIRNGEGFPDIEVEIIELSKDRQ